jgi:hypothetical protein
MRICVVFASVGFSLDHSFEENRRSLLLPLQNPLSLRALLGLSPLSRANSRAIDGNDF